MFRIRSIAIAYVLQSAFVGKNVAVQVNPGDEDIEPSPPPIPPDINLSVTMNAYVEIKAKQPQSAPKDSRKQPTVITTTITAVIPVTQSAKIESPTKPGVESAEIQPSMITTTITVSKEIAPVTPNTRTLITSPEPVETTTSTTTTTRKVKLIKPSRVQPAGCRDDMVTVQNIQTMSETTLWSDLRTEYRARTKTKSAVFPTDDTGNLLTTMGDEWPGRVQRTEMLQSNKNTMIIQTVYADENVNPNGLKKQTKVETRIWSC